jgi:hypothetical protein
MLNENATHYKTYIINYIICFDRLSGQVYFPPTPAKYKRPARTRYAWSDLRYFGVVVNNSGKAKIFLDSQVNALMPVTTDSLAQFC